MHEESSENVSLDDAIEVAARWLSSARAILIGSGAGMSVDSGLGTYRGKCAGVWGPLQTLGIDYHDICTPDALAEDPQLVWAFWRHCITAYREAEPHEGYHILQRWGREKHVRNGLFCYTTNVDALWPRTLPAECVYEAHGSTAYLQCSAGRNECSQRPDVWPCLEDIASAVRLEDSHEDRVAKDSVPSCPSCHAPARPNVLMFGDLDFRRRRRNEQGARYKEWLRNVEADFSLSAPLVCIEMGAGRAVPTVRTEFERIAMGVAKNQPLRIDRRLIRINPEDCSLPAELVAQGRAVAIPLGALDALRKLDACMNALKHRQNEADFEREQ